MYIFTITNSILSDASCTIYLRYLLCAKTTKVSGISHDPNIPLEDPDCSSRYQRIQYYALLYVCNAHIHIHIHTYIQIHMYIYIHIYTYMYKCIYA